MRFPYPCFPAEFEIPDDWWAEAGIAGFRPSREAYCSDHRAPLLRLEEIEPPPRSKGCERDFRGFDKMRLIGVLRDIVSGTKMEPVTVVKLAPRSEFILIGYDYQVNDGFHRYHATVAAGFTHIPVAITSQISVDRDR
jgi:hypothetical protein